ncbi:MAG: cysteine dioxygenase family protein [Crocinitomicaceae bacterium]
MNRLTLPVSISSLIDKIGDQRSLSPTEIRNYIREANIQKEDLLDWADFDHNINEGYGRKLVYKQDHYEIMVMSWAPFDSTAVHDHGYTSWGAVQVFGELEHITFDYEDQYLTIDLKEKLSAGEIITVNNDMIHQMVNYHNKRALSLHVYGTDKDVESVTSSAQLYNVSNGQVELVDGGVYYDLKECDYILKGEEFETDRLTEIAHYTLLLQHYFKTGNKGQEYRACMNYFHNRSFEGRLINELEMDSKRVLYFIELKRARKLLRSLGESTRTLDSMINDINEFERYS